MLFWERDLHNIGRRGRKLHSVASMAWDAAALRRIVGCRAQTPRSGAASCLVDRLLGKFEMLRRGGSRAPGTRPGHTGGSRDTIGLYRTHSCVIDTPSAASSAARRTRRPSTTPRASVTWLGTQGTTPMPSPRADRSSSSSSRPPAPGALLHAPPAPHLACRRDRRGAPRRHRAKSRKSHLLSGAPLAGLLPVVM